MMKIVLVKTVYVPHENANLVFPIVEGKPVFDIVWIPRPARIWKDISRVIYLEKLRMFRWERKSMMRKIAEEWNPHFEEWDLIFGVKNNEAPSLWEMVHTWRKHGPRDFDRSI